MNDIGNKIFRMAREIKKNFCFPNIFKYTSDLKMIWHTVVPRWDIIDCACMYTSWRKVSQICSSKQSFAELARFVPNLTINKFRNLIFLMNFKVTFNQLVGFPAKMLARATSSPWSRLAKLDSSKNIGGATFPCHIQSFSSWHSTYGMMIAKWLEPKFWFDQLAPDSGT